MVPLANEVGARKGANGQDVLIVDVREPDEVALGSIPSSVNLPLSELKDALSPNFGEGDFKKVSHALFAEWRHTWRHWC